MSKSLPTADIGPKLATCEVLLWDRNIRYINVNSFRAERPIGCLLPGPTSTKPDTHTQNSQSGRMMCGVWGAGLSGQQEPWEAGQLAARTMENPAQQKHPARVREWLWGREGEGGGGKQRARSAVWTSLHITTHPHPGPPPPGLTPAGTAERREKRCPRCPGGHRRFSHAARSSLRPGRRGGGALGPAG